MFLTVVNYLGKKLPRGHIFRGKNRLVKEVTRYDVEKLKREFAIEEKNMFYLRHPYLTQEQSRGHVQHLNKHQKWMDKKIGVRDEKFSLKGRTLESELSHLKCNIDWDFKAGAS